MARAGVELTAPLSDPDFYAGDPHPLFARLRREAPVAWHEELGFWAVTRHADVLAVSRDPEAFCSSRGVLLMDLGRDLPDVPGALLYVDPPQHQRYRRIVLPAFTPSRMRDLAGPIRARTSDLLDAVPTGEPVDLVEALALPLPLLVIADLLGIPGARWPEYARWSEAAIDAGTAQTPATDQALAEMAGFFVEVIEAKRADPAEDLISLLVSTESVDPETGDAEQLDAGELLMFCIQLLVAGNETTRNLISGGLWALAEHPEQLARLVADRTLLPRATEELLRWTTPVTSFVRTATRPARVGDQDVAEGEPLLLLYASANRDEDAFGPSAAALDVGRDPNHQVAFGFGEHFCLGAGLARQEGRIVLEEVLARWSRLEPAGELRRLPSAGVVNGVLAAPVVLR